MRFEDLIKQPNKKKQRPLTYTESLEQKLKHQMTEKPAPKFTALEWAAMEGGHGIEDKKI